MLIRYTILPVLGKLCVPFAGQEELVFHQEGKGRIVLSKKWFVIITAVILFGLSSAAYAQSQDILVIWSSDDAEESSSGGMNLGSSDLEMVQESATQTVGGPVSRCEYSTRFTGYECVHTV